jgi:hypothetical protein
MGQPEFLLMVWEVLMDYCFWLFDLGSLLVQKMSLELVFLEMLKCLMDCQYLFKPH